jgi:cystathionine beta-synthase
VGSAGTLTGLSRFFSKAAPHVDLVLADPAGSVLTKYVNEGILDASGGSWLVEGIGGDYLTAISDFSRVRKAYAIKDSESFDVGRELLMKEGILGGSSTGTVIAAALRYCREQTTPKKVVAFVCDTGNKYLSKMFNDYWMLDNGFVQRESYGDLRDLILRPYAQRDTVVVKPADLLTMAYQRMKLYDVSQLPVMEGDRIVGIVDESDILMHVYADQQKFQDPVSTAMISNLTFVQVTDSMQDLMPIFDKGQVAIVMKKDAFLGLITRMDLLNYLRRRSS